MAWYLLCAVGTRRLTGSCSFKCHFTSRWYRRCKYRRPRLQRSVCNRIVTHDMASRVITTDNRIQFVYIILWDWSCESIRPRAQHCVCLHIIECNVDSRLTTCGHSLAFWFWVKYSLYCEFYNLLSGNERIVYVRIIVLHRRCKSRRPRTQRGFCLHNFALDILLDYSSIVSFFALLGVERNWLGMRFAMANYVHESQCSTQKNTFGSMIEQKEVVSILSHFFWARR